MTRLHTPTEHGEQAALIRMAELHQARYPDLRWLHAIPNGGARDAITGARMKAEGVKRGVLDLQLASGRTLPNGTRAPGIVIEMKVGKGKLTPEQVEWLAHYQAEGWIAVVCYSAGDAWAALKSYVELPK